MEKKSRRGKTARHFGHTFELELVHKFKEAGWSDTMTSRLGSRLADSLGMDLINVSPFAVQSKATSCSIPCLKATFAHIIADSSEYKVYCLKIRNKGNYAILELDDFFELVGMLKKEKIL